MDLRNWQISCESCWKHKSQILCKIENVQNSSTLLQKWKSHWDTKETMHCHYFFLAYFFPLSVTHFFHSKQPSYLVCSQLQQLHLVPPTSICHPSHPTNLSHSFHLSLLFWPFLVSFKFMYLIYSSNG
jgi:hypothetical protein